MPSYSVPMRVHGAFISEHEVQAVTDFISHHASPEGIDNRLDNRIDSDMQNLDTLNGIDLDADESADSLYNEAVEIVVESRKASISYLQRRLKIGYNRAARMIEEMEKAGIVSAIQSNGAREVLAAAPPKSA